MALAAAQVVDALAARLVPMAATAGRVYTSRTYPLTEADLPAWRVTAGDESCERSSMDGINLHNLEVLAACSARATANLDDTLHALASSGLQLLFAGPVPYALQLDGIERDLSTDAEAAVGVITLRLRALFYAAPAAPDTILSA